MRFIRSSIFAFKFYICPLYGDTSATISVMFCVLSLLPCSPTTLAGIASSILLFVVIIATMVCCFMCSCCYLYQRRQQRARTPFDGEYSSQCSPTSTGTIFPLSLNNNSLCVFLLICSPAYPHVQLPSRAHVRRLWKTARAV